MSIRIQIDSKGIHDLAFDCDRISARAYPQANRIVEHAATKGNRIAKENARQSSGRHGKHYPDAFFSEQVGPAAHEYGPIVGPKQGAMSFEFGSRNQPPHLDLAKSADIIGPELGRDLSRWLDRTFW